MEPELSHSNTWQDHRAVPETHWKHGLRAGWRKMCDYWGHFHGEMMIAHNAAFSGCLLELCKWWLSLGSGSTRCPSFYCVILGCLKSCLPYLCVLREKVLDSVMLFFCVSVSGKFEAVIAQINGILGILSPS